MTLIYWLALVPHIVWAYKTFPGKSKSLWYRLNPLVTFSTMFVTGTMFAWGLSNLLR